VIVSSVIRRGVVIFTLVALVACGAAPRQQPEQPVAPSPYLAVAKGQVDVEGGVYRLAASRDGIVMDVSVGEGDYVTRGQVLARLDDRQARLGLAHVQAQVRQARAEAGAITARLAAARREAQRLAPLAADDTVARRDADLAADEANLLAAQLETANAAIDVAERARAVAAYEIEQRAIRAPLEGRIIRSQARLGDGVSTLNVTPLFLFAPMASRIVRAELDERFVDGVRPGLAAEIALEVDERRTFSGRVLRVGHVFGGKPPSGDPSEPVDVRTVECVLSIDDQDLRIGQRVLVRILKEGPAPSPGGGRP
jgi:HlyD family secretion protein